MLSIQTNLSSLTIQDNLNINNNNMQKSMERLSSGFRINSAADDSAGYAISAKLSGQQAGMEAASNNAMQATALVNMADSAINQIQNMVVRIQALATEAASANNSSDISKLEAERAKLETEIDKIANSSNYNGVNLLNGLNSQVAAATYAATSAAATASQVSLAANGVSGTQVGTFSMSVIGTTTSAGTVTFSDSLGNTATAAVSIGAATSTGSVTLDGDTFNFTVGTSALSTTAATTAISFTAGSNVAYAAYTGSLAFQVGADNSTNDQVAVNLQDSYTTSSLGLTGGNVSVFNSATAAAAYIATAKAAMDKLTTQRADLGATVNQLGYVNANLQSGIEQEASAISTIKDANMAQEMANYTKSSILVQAGTALMSKADQNAMNVLALFK